MEEPRITAKVAGRPLHPLLRPFVIGYFFAVCACELLYSQAQTEASDFASITEWLLGAGPPLGLTLSLSTVAVLLATPAQNLARMYR